MNDKLYIYGPTGLIAVKDGSTFNYILKDHLGSTRAVVNSSGSRVAKYHYSPYGRIMYSYVNTDVAYKFTGQEFDDETGLHNFRARLYDAELGMFYAYDPAAQGFSPFGYAGNNPVIYIDKDGRWFIIDDLIVSAVSFVTGYLSHGLTTGNWGWDALKAGGISAGVGLLSYYTGGAAAGLLFSEGSFGYALTASVVGGTVGGAGGSIANQLAFTGKVDWNLVGRSTVSGFGGGLIGGAAGYYLTGDPVLTSMIGGAVSGGIEGSYEGQFLQGAFMGSWWGGFSGALMAKGYDIYGEYLINKYYDDKVNKEWSCHNFRADVVERMGLDEFMMFENEAGIAPVDLTEFNIHKGDILFAPSHSGIELGRNMYGQNFILSKLNVGLPAVVKTAGYLSSLFGNHGYYYLQSVKNYIGPR